MSRRTKLKASNSRWFSADGLLTNHLPKSTMTSEGTTATLKTPVTSQRRGSFLYRSDVTEEQTPQQQQQQQQQHLLLLGQQQQQQQQQQLSGQQQQFLAMPSLSAKCQSNNSSVSPSPTPDHNFQEDPLITPFAQILQRLQIARNSYVELTRVTDRRRRRSSNYNTDPSREYNYSSSLSSPSLTMTTATKYPEEFCLEILDDLDWCLDQLEAIQTNKSVGDLATIKFKKILTKELNQLAESSKSGSLISEYISTFFDKEDETQIENEPVVIQIPAAFSTVRHFHPTKNNSVEASSTAATAAAAAAAADVARGTVMCDIPGVRKLDHGKVEGGEGVHPNGVPGLDDERLKEYMVGLSEWNFDIFKLDEITNKNSLVVTAYTIFRERNLLSTFRIPHDSMVAYFTRIQAHYYLENFYHNRMHAADVTHAVHVMLSKAPQLAILSDLEILSVLFAAVIHDVDHPGLTNPYLINTNADLALMYNDESVLENHHLAVAFKLLQETNSDIFVNLPSRARQRLRKMVIDMVLATDMTKHMSLLADLKTKVETKKLSGADPLITDNYGDRMEVLKCLLHCADLGNPTKSLHIYNQWVDRIMKEFFNQGDIERNLGIEISPMCDRHTASVEKSQVSFIEYIVHPLWETWADLVDPHCNDIVDVIEANKKHFEGLAAQKCTSPLVLLAAKKPSLDNDVVAARGGGRGGGVEGEETLFGFEDGSEGFESTGRIDGGQGDRTIEGSRRLAEVTITINRE